jgi:hypothetical protein
MKLKRLFVFGFWNGVTMVCVGCDVSAMGMHDV